MEKTTVSKVVATIIKAGEELWPSVLSLAMLTLLMYYSSPLYEWGIFDQEIRFPVMVVSTLLFGFLFLEFIRKNNTSDPDREPLPLEKQVSRYNKAAIVSSCAVSLISVCMLMTKVFENTILMKTIGTMFFWAWIFMSTRMVFDLIRFLYYYFDWREKQAEGH